jgi:hypothetical protein
MNPLALSEFVNENVRKRDQKATEKTNAKVIDQLQKSGFTVLKLSGANKPASPARSAVDPLNRNLSDDIA